MGVGVMIVWVGVVMGLKDEVGEKVIGMGCDIVIWRIEGGEV